MTTFTLSAEVLHSYSTIAQEMRDVSESSAKITSNIFDLANKERRSDEPNVARADKLLSCGHNILAELDKSFSASRIINTTCAKLDTRIKITDATALYYLDAKAEAAAKGARKLIKKLLENPTVQAYKDPQLMNWAEELDGELKNIIKLSKQLWRELEESLTPSIHSHYENKKKN